MSKDIPGIADFDFEAQNAKPDKLIQAWMPEIEAAAQEHVPDDRFIAFLIAALRLGARSKNLRSLNVMQVVQNAGYSRSTFFRLFEGHTTFLLKGYQLTCLLSTKVYAQHLSKHRFTLDEFCEFTTDVFYGANCTVPTEIIQMLWREHELPHHKFHPHLADLAPTISTYLSRNDNTKHLSIDLQELTGVLRDLDLAILNARLEGDPLWGTPLYYQKLRKMLQGYLLTCG